MSYIRKIRGKLPVSERTLECERTVELIDSNDCPHEIEQWEYELDQSIYYDIEDIRKANPTWDYTFSECGKFYIFDEFVKL